MILFKVNQKKAIQWNIWFKKIKGILKKCLQFLYKLLQHNFSGVSLFALTFKLQTKLTFITSNFYISIYIIRYERFSQTRRCCGSFFFFLHHSLYSCRMCVTSEWHKQETSEASVCLMNRLLSETLLTSAGSCDGRETDGACVRGKCAGQRQKGRFKSEPPQTCRGVHSFIYRWEYRQRFHDPILSQHYSHLTLLWPYC